MHNELDLKQALSNLLDEKTFLSEGGTIGFGLLHEYPVSKNEGSLTRVLGCLKGSDAAIRRVCASLGLELKPKVLYKETYRSVLILLDKFVELGYVDTMFEFLLCMANTTMKMNQSTRNVSSSDRVGWRKMAVARLNIMMNFASFNIFIVRPPSSPTQAHLPGSCAISASSSLVSRSRM